MTSQEVIRLGEKITEPLAQNYFGTTYFFVPLILVVCVALISIWLGLPEELIGGYTIMVAFISVFSSIIIFSMNHSSVEETERHSKEIKAWKTEVALPYIKTLPKSQQPLDMVVLDIAEIKGETLEDELPLVLSYEKGGKTIIKADTYTVKKTLKEGEQPYLEYIQLNKGLGHGINKGVYYPKVYVPKDFKLFPSSTK